jgi:hypothetical protein
MVDGSFVEALWAYVNSDDRSLFARERLITQLQDILKQSEYYKNEEIFDIIRKNMPTVSSYAPASNIFDVLKSVYGSQVDDKDFTSVASYLALLVGMPLASTGLYSEVQIHTFKFNSAAGAMAGKQISDAPIVILEGDEYLTSPLDSRPKFLWYHPHIALISGIAWDHMNVFPTWESYVDAFRSFAKTMPVNGYLVFDQEDQALFSLMNEDSLPGTRVGYGPHQHEVTQERCSLITKNGKIPIEVFGKHNLKNIEGARLICHQLGISDETFYQGIQSFKGAAKRMEAWKNTKSEVVFRDFAHSPSKLKATVDAVRLQYPERYVTAVFELFTYSSLNSAFLPQYQGSMDAADEAWIYYNPDQLSMKKLPYFEPSLVEESFNHTKLKILIFIKYFIGFAWGSFYLININKCLIPTFP